MKKLLYIFLFLILIFTKSIAQDIHFSQFNNTPLLINPSLSGEAGGNRFILNYRNQWRSITKNSYKTTAFSYDSYFSKDKFSMGVMVFKDKAGDGDLSLSQINLSGASKVKINENNYLKLGIQAGFSQRKIDMSNLTWNSQAYDGRINPNLASGEINSNINASYFDISTGLLWTSQMSEYSKVNIGFSAYHVNRPSYDFLSKNSNVNIRWNGHIDVEIAKSNSNIIYYPSVLYMQQGKGKEINIGGIIKYDLGLDSKYTGKLISSSLYFGAFYRYNDAIIAYTRLNYRKQFDICITYDINLSSLYHSTHAKGGMELSLIYNLNKKKSIRKY